VATPDARAQIDVAKQNSLATFFERRSNLMTSSIGHGGRVVGIFAVTLFLTASASCSSSTASDGGGDGGAGGSGDACAKPTVNTEDGSSACGPATCEAGHYCAAEPAGDCENGCTALDNCPRGQFCDLSNPSTDPNGKSVGTCRTPASCTVVTSDSGGSSCPDVHGVYTVTLDTASSSQGCSSGFSNTTCTVTETNCSLAWSCTPNNGFESSTLDGSGDSTVIVPAPGGSGNATCSLAFSSGAFTFDCQFTGGGSAVDCKGNGTEK
jgi:hypothetical protein